MSYMMLHGLGDCTPGHNCGCIPKQPPAASVLYEHTSHTDYVLTIDQLAAIRAIVSHSRAAGRDRLLVVLDRLIDDYPRPTEEQP